MNIFSFIEQNVLSLHYFNEHLFRNKMKTLQESQQKVMVTGATGYVAGWIVKRLLEEGHTVHATVRDPQNDQKIAHLKEMASESAGTIRFFKADLLNTGDFSEAMEGCQLVYHTASPFTTSVKDPQKELIDPAVQGTENVLLEANRTPSVERVVVTSSCAAIYTDAIDTQKAPNNYITEETWNTSASLDYQPYALSKTLAEKRAWEIAESQDRWKLVTINPSLVMGPALNKGKVTSESFNLLEQMGDGTMRFGGPKVGIGMVDVRDVAEAHYRAGFHPNAEGRYITSAHNSNFLEIAQSLLPRYGDEYPLPKGALPKWLLLLVGPLINNNLSRRYIRNNVNVPFKADNSKIKNELGIEFRPMQQTMEAAFEDLIKRGRI